MAELPRDRSHFYLQNVGRAEQYTTRQRPRTPPQPIRDREAHARALEGALNQAIAGARERAQVRPPAEAAAGGFYLQFELPPGNERFVQNLEDRRRGIELVSVKQSNENSPAFATVFVPFRAANRFQRLLDEYRTVNAKSGRPRHEGVVNRIDSIALAAIRSVFTEDENLLPPEETRIWWEVWLRTGLLAQFRAAAEILNIELRANEVIEFTEREVTLALSDLASLGRLMATTDTIAEVRLARDRPASFLEMNNVEQTEWVADLVARLEAPAENSAAVCILDSAMNQSHQLLSVALLTSDLHTYNVLWGTGDSAIWQGHGTAMGGIALYGDLASLLMSTARG